MGQLNSANFYASGQINIASFVKLDPANPYCILQTTGPSDLPVGISQQGSFTAPGVAGSNVAIATPVTAPTGTQPSEIQVFGPGDVCRLQLSPQCNAIVPGQILYSDPNGLGIDAGNNLISGSELRYPGAVALTKGAAGQFIRVLVICPDVGGSTPIRVSLTPGVIGTNQSNVQTFAVAGLPGSTTAAVVVSGENLTAGVGIVNAHILSAGSIQITFANLTAASIVPAAQFFDIGFIA